MKTTTKVFASNHNRMTAFAFVFLLAMGCSHKRVDPAVFESGGEDIANTEAVEETPTDVGGDPISSTRTSAEVEADDLARKTFPLVYNEMVENWINYFTGRGRPVMEKWLGRSTRYIPLMQEVLREEGLPEDLIYLSMIESGFNIKARSRAAAVGPWQFIRATGRRYGLEVTYWLDERQDLKKSTYAAAKYLKELHQVFGSWYLAAAGYNAGEGRVLMAVREDRSRNFWELARKKSNFRAETRNYVPKIIAAALISKNPRKYGFDKIDYQLPLAWEKVKIPNGVTLRSVARILDLNEQSLHLMNAELRRGITPPGDSGYELRVPPEKKDLLIASLDKLEAKKIGNFLEHRIRRGQTLSHIARRYGTSVWALKEVNKIRSERTLRIGRTLLIPIPDRYISGRRSRKRSRVTRRVARGTPGGNYRVRRGDTLWSIAEANGTSVSELKQLNDIRNSRSLRAGDTIRLPGGEESSARSPNSRSESKERTTYRVRRGDTLWSISRRYGTSISELKKINDIRSSRSLRPGDVLKIPN